MKPGIPNYSVKRNASTLVYSGRVGKMEVEHVFPTGIDPKVEENIYNQFKKQVAELIAKDIANQRSSNQ